MSEPLEADRAPGAPHPRDAGPVVGQDQAQAQFLDAFNSGRMHHGWLITGARGVGKATLAWRIARFLLATPIDDGGLFGAPEPPTSLEINPDHPVAHRLAAMSEPRLFLLRRPWDVKTERLRTEITVEEVRKLKSFFALSAPDGGRRVVIVDAAEEMNSSAANALLKLLEEPPENTFILLVSHQPSRLLPTIRSRCRSLRCRTLDESEIARILAGLETDTSNNAALSVLANGSAGAALRLLSLDGLALYRQITAIFAQGFDRPAALKLAEGSTGRANAEKLDLILELFDHFQSRLARAGIHGPPLQEAAPGESELLSRLSPNSDVARAWAELQQVTSSRARHGQAVNLDPAALILDIVLKIHETAAKKAA